MSFRPCATGCGRYLAPGDGHDYCLTCLGLAHVEVALMDGTCSHCGNMTISLLRSRFQYLEETGAPSYILFWCPLHSLPQVENLLFPFVCFVLLFGPAVPTFSKKKINFLYLWVTRGRCWQCATCCKHLSTPFPLSLCLQAAVCGPRMPPGLLTHPLPHPGTR